MSVENNNDFLRWDVKPVWTVTFKSDIIGAGSGTHSFEVLGLNRSAGDISRNWEKIHSVEQFNQGRSAKPGDYTITIAVKENGNAYEALRRLSKGAVEFDISCDLIADAAGVVKGSLNAAGKHVWMKGFEKFVACVCTRESQTIEIGEFPVREFECDALRHIIMKYGDLKALVEGDGTYPTKDAFDDAKTLATPSV